MMISITKDSTRSLGRWFPGNFHFLLVPNYRSRCTSKSQQTQSDYLLFDHVQLVKINTHDTLRRRTKINQVKTKENDDVR